MQNSYHQLTIKTDKQFVDLISDFVSLIYADGIEIGEDRIIIRSEERLDHIKKQVKDLAKSIDKINISFECKELPNSDWIEQYQQSIQPIEVGKFYIHPSWDKPKDDKINIIVDPALAFGSGHHGSTYGCLEAIGKYVQSGDNVIDVGCGSGILGLAATKLGATVDLCDTDIVSVESTKENFKLNNEKYNKIWQGSVNKTEKKYDIVLANIIADVLKAIAANLKSSIEDNGILIISGILDKKESSLKEHYSDLKLLERKQKDEWVTLIYKKEFNG